MYELKGPLCNVHVQVHIFQNTCIMCTLHQGQSLIASCRVFIVMIVFNVSINNKIIPSEKESEGQ